MKAFFGALILATGCATPPLSKPPSFDQKPAVDLYVGQGRGGSVGFYVREGEVIGGYVLPSRWNISDESARILAEPLRDSIGRTIVYPITRVECIGQGVYRVVAVGDASLERFELVVTEVDERCLFYRMAPVEDSSVVAYSGTAINVAALAARWNR